MQVAIKHNVNQRQQRGYQRHWRHLWYKFNKFKFNWWMPEQWFWRIATSTDIQEWHTTRPLWGCTYQSQLGDECQAMLCQCGDHKDEGHPYLPWSNVNQIWVTNLIYTQARISIMSTNILLQGLKEGKARIESVNFYTAKKMFSLLDNADYVPVHSFYSWIYFLYIQGHFLHFFLIEVSPWDSRHRICSRILEREIYCLVPELYWAYPKFI